MNKEKVIRPKIKIYIYIQYDALYNLKGEVIWPSMSYMFRGHNDRQTRPDVLLVDPRSSCA